MIKVLLTALALLFSANVSFAVTPVQTQPYPVTSTNASGTIGSTNDFQSVFVASKPNTGRVACTIQNNGANAMWVFFGPIASATNGSSVELAVGQSVNCNSGGVILQDQVSITGTSGDAFFAAQQ